MWRNKMPIAIVILMGLAAGLLAAGCRGSLSGPHRAAFKPPPVRGAVDLDRLISLNPDYAFVRQTDAALGAYYSAMTENAGSVSVPNVEPGKEFAPEPVALAPGLGYPEADLRGRLAASGADLLTTLKMRLDASNKLAQAAAAAEAEADGESRFNAQRDQVIEKEYRSILMILPGEADKRINLNLAIGALTLDIDPATPKTAPAGYWEAKLTQRRTELSDLDADLDRKMQQAIAVQVAEIAELRKTIDAQTASKIAQSAADLDSRSAARVTEYTSLLADRQESILGAARTFDQQMVGALEAGAARPASVSEPAGVRMLDSTSTREWASRLDSTVRYLMLQRQRQLNLVRQETVRDVLDVAKSKNLLIVGWRTTPAAGDLTAQVLSGLRGQGWTQ